MSLRCLTFIYISVKHCYGPQIHTIAYNLFISDYLQLFSTLFWSFCRILSQHNQQLFRMMMTYIDLRFVHHVLIELSILAVKVNNMHGNQFLFLFVLFSFRNRKTFNIFCIKTILMFVFVYVVFYAYKIYLQLS